MKSEHAAGNNSMQSFLGGIMKRFM